MILKELNAIPAVSALVALQTQATQCILSTDKLSLLSTARILPPMGIQKKLNAPLGNHMRIVIWNRDSELLRNGTMV